MCPIELLKENQYVAKCRMRAYELECKERTLQTKRIYISTSKIKRIFFFESDLCWEQVGAVCPIVFTENEQFGNHISEQ